ncbi:anthrone oxygenase family protein [Nocardioides sp. URHA0020]|uniref:anthrone oxygenase family protein n=1 Tax=Nocardioides sp. URHA0020 TaxID=1380392 RepID=UPI00056B2702|nr:anthrone oxygenase family protein [Nocardioides sp. URHA0020]
MSDLLDTLRGPVLLVATVAAGLQAGTYYTWACGVMPGLARTDDHTFTSSMNHINVAIVNPVFMLTFLGAPALAALSVATTTSGARAWAITGLVLALGTVVVTAAGNVPLNDALAAGGSRAAFEDAWVRWNILRTLTSTGALACLAWAAWKS